MTRAGTFVLPTFERLLAEVTAARIFYVALRHNFLRTTATTLCHKNEAFGTFILIVAVMVYRVIAVVFSCTRKRAIRRLGTTGNGREENSSTTMA